MRAALKVDALAGSVIRDHHTNDRIGIECGDGRASDPANQQLLNWNNDPEIDLSDAVAMFNWLFRGGPEHYLGTACQPIAGCPSVCKTEL